MNLSDFIQNMPKVELHVHLEGAIRPETLLALAGRHGITLPARSVDELRAWYTFTDFSHFIEVYHALAGCLRTPEDIETITRDFLRGQAAQNIIYTEATCTPFNQYRLNGLSCAQQMEAINRARAWGEQELGVRLGLVIDIPREIEAQEGLQVAEWAIEWFGRGVVAFGLGGPEVGHPPEKHAAAFARTRAAGLPGVPHAGETAGADSIWGALRALQAVRIGHGVRCLEDPALVAELRRRQVPLEVCPSSNVCLKVVPSLGEHPLPRLLQAGLLVTLNSDDPPMFNTSLTQEYRRCAEAFGFDAATCAGLVLNAARASCLPPPEKQALEARLRADFQRAGLSLPA